MFADLTVAAFAESLASDQPTPGGGAGAALVGALAASLVAMVGRHTIGRPRYAAVNERVTAIVAEADDLRVACQDLMDADAAAFQAVSAAYKLARDDAARPGRLEAGLRQATDVPLALIRDCSRLEALADEIGQIGNKTLSGDAASAGLLARAAARASAVNVRTNCAAIQDRAYAEASLAELKTLLGDGEV